MVEQLSIAKKSFVLILGMCLKEFSILRSVAALEKLEADFDLV